MRLWNRLLQRRGAGPEPGHLLKYLGASLCFLTLLAIGRGFAGQPNGVSAESRSSRRLGVVGFYNPRLLYAKYQQLADYLTEATGEKWELEVTLDYEETLRAFCSGKLDLAYLGPFSYLRARESCGATPVVRLNTRGSATYRSLIMVRQESPYQDLSDLRGKVFAFGSPLSTSSHLMPRLMLLNAGLKTGKDITCRYLGHHDRAARAVVLGEADACGVRDIVGNRFAHRGLRVLKRSEPIPNFPLVVRAGSSAAFRRSLVKALIERPKRNPEIRRRMRGWDEEIAMGFALVSDADYDPVRRMVDQLFGPRGLKGAVSGLECGKRG